MWPPTSLAARRRKMLQENLNIKIKGYFEGSKAYYIRISVPLLRKSILMSKVEFKKKKKKIHN